MGWFSDLWRSRNKRREDKDKRHRYARSSLASVPLTADTPAQKPSGDEGDFVTSMVVAQATNSTLLGYVVGGDLVGAIVGDALTPDDSPSPLSDGDHDSVSNDDSSGSDDSGSDCGGGE